MKKSKWGIYSLAMGAFALAITGCGGKTETSEAPAPAASRRARGPAHLGVYDVRGRLVRTLIHGTLEAGAHQAAWDGTSEGGSRVGAGVYFCRLQCAAGTRVERLVLAGVGSR